MRTIIILIFSLVLGFECSAQSTIHKVYGRILQDSTELQGALVLLKKSKKSTVSDINGNFSLVWDKTLDSLRISALSFETQTIAINAQSVFPLSIALKPIVRKLNEVNISLNTGFQTLSKERATGSFVKIDNNLFNEQAGVNVLERLKYIANGVAPISNRITPAKGLLIRGLSTLAMSIQSPLIILDNFEYKGDLDNLNPNDVESITFLKDAAAGSIWGAKAANGVIVVTSKKGNYNQKTSISFNTNLSLTDKPNLLELPQINSSELIEVEKYLFVEKFRFADVNSSKHPAFSPVFEILFKLEKGQLTDIQANERLEKLKSHDLRNDFSKYIYQSGLNRQYSLNLNGGTGNYSWSIGTGFDKTRGLLKEESQRLNVHIFNSYRLIENLEFNANIHFTQSNNSSGAPAYGTIRSNYGIMPIYASIIDDNGNSTPFYNKYREEYINTAGGGKLLDWNYYPLEDYKHNQNKKDLQDINAVLGLNYRVRNGINLDLKYRYEKQDIENNAIADLQSFYARDLINNFSQISNNEVLYKIPKGDILDRSIGNIIAQNIRGQINFDHNWKEHSLQAILGSEFSESIAKSNNFRTYGYNQNTLGFANVDFVNTYPNFVSGKSFISSGQDISGTNTRFASIYGNGAYTYKSKYTISGSLRRDASNIFGVDQNDKWKFLWSSGLSWELSKESFYQFDLLPLLKFRLTYGSQGNVDPSRVAVLTLKYESPNPYLNLPTASMSNYLNPDLKWEQVNMINFAVDFGFKNNRISGSVEYYHKNSIDLYGLSPIDVTAGLGVDDIVKNIGNMKGNGVDVQFNTLNMTGVFKWNSVFIFNTYIDKVVKYNNPTTYSQASLVGNTGSIEGNPSFYLTVFKSAGLDPNTGDPLGYLNGDVSKDWEKIISVGDSNKDIKFVGRRIPPVFGSIGNNFLWNGFSLSMRLSYRFGHYFLRESVDYSALVQSLIGHSDFSKRWQKSGDEKITSIPSMIYPIDYNRSFFYQNSESLVEKGDNIRLEYINFSYSINRKNFKKLPFSSIKVYGVVNNIGTIWKATDKKIDPDAIGLSPSSTYSFGLSINY